LFRYRKWSGGAAGLRESKFTVSRRHTARGAAEPPDQRFDFASIEEAHAKPEANRKGNGGSAGVEA